MQNLIVALIIAIFITAFALLNSEPVSINLIVREINNVPLSLVILVSVLFGVIIAGALSLIDQTKIRAQMKSLTGKSKEAQAPASPEAKSIVDEVKEKEEANG